MTLGSISVVDQDNMGSELKLKSVVPVSSPAEQIESVIDQVKEGFELIAEINAEAEEEQIEDTQDKQEDAIEEVMEEANDEAADIIEDEDDASEAAEEVEEVMEPGVYWFCKGLLVRNHRISESYFSQCFR